MKKLNEKLFLEDLKALLKIKTVSGDAGAVSDQAPLGERIYKAIDYMLELGKKEGFKTKNCDGYCGYIEMGQGDEMIAILTHLDTVPAGNDWSVAPFDLTLVDDKVMGRGALDDKGPAMVSFYAMKALKEMGVSLNRRIRLILGGDEESGEWQCLNHYKKDEETPLYSFSPDSGFPVIFAEKGIMNLTLSKELDQNELSLLIEGGNQINAVPDYAKACVNEQCYEIKGKAAHASEPQKGVNAILKLGKLLAEQGLKHSILELLAIADKDGFDIALSDDLSGELTLTPSIINVDRNKAKLECDIRYPVSFDSQEVVERVEKAVNPLGFKVEMTHDVKPLHVDRDGFLVKTLQEVYKNYTGDDSEPIVSGGGTYARAFKNAVAFGGVFPGEENMCHQKDEYWSLSSIRKNYEIIIEVLLKLAE